MFILSYRNKAFLHLYSFFLIIKYIPVSTDYGSSRVKAANME